MKLGQCVLVFIHQTQTAEVGVGSYSNIDWLFLTVYVLNIQSAQQETVLGGHHRSLQGSGPHQEMPHSSTLLAQRVETQTFQLKRKCFVCFVWHYPTKKH